MTRSREERMRALTGEVPADVAGVVVLCNRLGAAVADVQETIGRIEARQVTMDARAEELLAGLERGSATRHADLQTAVGSLAQRLEAVDAGNLNDAHRHHEALVRVCELLVRILPPEQRDALAVELGLPTTKPAEETPPAPSPEPPWNDADPATYPSPVPDVDERTIAEAAAARPTTLDDLADLLDPPASSVLHGDAHAADMAAAEVDPLATSDDGSAS